MSYQGGFMSYQGGFMPPRGEMNLRVKMIFPNFRRKKRFLRYFLNHILSF